MRIVRLALKRETALPVLALALASGVNMSLVVARTLWTWNLGCAFLVWNLFLAWLPLVFALLACEQFERNQKWTWRFSAFAVSWLLFFPNAPYIFTDLIHLVRSLHFHAGRYIVVEPGTRFWVDMILIVSAALTGLILGFLSLYLMQQIVTRRYGNMAGWGFIAATAALGSFGVCLGRFSRFNSWDVLVRPIELCQGIGSMVTSPFAQPTVLAFPLLLATFLFLAYLSLYALTHMQQMQPVRTQS
jgi:uncharacterized membrane protein